jgi:hypothetical protein
MSKEIVNSDSLNEIELIHYELDNQLLTSDDYIYQPPTTEQKYLYVYNHMGLGHIFYKRPVGLPEEYVGKIKLEVEE